MALYKVHFKNNSARSGTRLTVADCRELSCLGTEGSRTVLKWCIVDAAHELEALQTAEKIAMSRWGHIIKQAGK